MINCRNCGKSLSQDEIGLALKLIGRSTEKFYCLDCMTVEAKTDKEKLLEIIENYRNMGCELFTPKRKD